MKKIVRTLVVLALVTLANDASAQKVRKDWATDSPATATPPELVATPTPPAPVEPPVPPADTAAAPPAPAPTPDWATKEELQSLRKEVAAAFAKVWEKQKAEAIEESTSSWATLIIRVLTGIVATIPVITAVVVWRRRRKTSPPNVRNTNVITVIAFMLLASASFAEEKKYEIRRMSTGANIVMDDDPTDFKVETKGCADVKSIRSVPGVTFTEVKGTPTSVTAKVAVDSENFVGWTGPVGFQLTLEDGTTVDSPEKIFLTVLTGGEAQVRKDLSREIATTAKEVAKLKVSLKQGTENLLSKINSAALDAMTPDKVAALLDDRLRPIQEKLASLEKIDAAQQGQIEEVAGNLDETMGNTQSLAGVVARLANRKTGLRHKPTDRAAGEFADRIAAKMAAVREKIALARAKARGGQ